MRIGLHILLGLLASSGPTVACPLPETAGRVTFQKPVEGEFQSGFGLRTHPLLMEKRMHVGVDFKAAPGTPVHAAAAGEVVFAGRNDEYGNLVIVRHGPELETAYAHLQIITVKAGDCLEVAAQLGGVGSTGLVVGPQLHFEVRKNGKFVDPGVVMDLGSEREAEAP